MLKIITGPMFAGKTTALIHALSSYSPEEVLVLKPSIDTRYTAVALATHDGRTYPATVIDTSAPSIADLLTIHTRMVVIDELNFFSFETLFPQINRIIDQGVSIIAAGLSFDFAKEPFGATLALMEYADSVVRLCSRCDQCGGSAEHSYRKRHLDDQLVVGGEELYGACCSTCWEELSV